MRAYHVTLDAQAPSILAEGLTPQVGPRSAEYGELAPAIYCFASEADLANGLGSPWFENAFGESDLACFEVDLDGLDVECVVDWEIMVRAPISPDRLRLVSELLDDPNLGAPTL